MTKALKQELLKDKRVVEEINRHLWIESEKAGQDIGFEKATEDWLQNFSQAWMEYHWSQKPSSQRSATRSKTTSASKVGSARSKAKTK